MLKQINHWLEPPGFPGDVDKTRQAKILYMLLKNILVFLLLAALGTIFIVVKKVAVSIILLTLLIWVLISWVLAQRGRVLAASRLFVVGAWIIFMLVILLTGRINTAFLSLLLGVMVMAGVLLGMRSAITLALLSTLVGLGLTILENADYPLVHYFPVPPLTGWIAWVLAFILTLTPLSPAIQSVSRSTEALRQRTFELGERVKELNCFYDLSHLIEASSESIERIMQGAVDLLPPAWQYPAIACARITLDGQTFSTSNFQQTPWMQLRPIFVNGVQAGGVEVGYLDAQPDSDEGPFLRQEGLLLNMVAEQLGKAVERIRAQQALRESEARFRVVAYNTPDHILVQDMNQRCTFVVNPQLGLTEQDMLGKTDYDFLPKDEADRLNEVKTQMLATGEAIRFETSLVSKTGKPEYYDGIYVPILDPWGQIDGLIGYFRNITERKQAEKEFNIALVKYKTLFDAFPLGVTVSDKKGVILETNRVAEKVLGISTEEHRGRDIDGPEWQIIRPDGTPMPSDEYASVRALKENRLIENVEMGIVTSPGVITWMNVTAAPIPLEEYGVVITYSDITKRKQAEEALRESEERLELVLEGSQLGYWDWNIETGQVERNARWAEMLGYTLEEIEFSVKQWTDLHHPDDRARAWQSIQDHLEGRGPEHRVEYRMRTKDGGYKWILDQAKIVKRDPLGKPLRMSGTHTDITERKEAENNVERGRKLLASTLDALPVGVCLTDETGRYRMMNDAYCAIYEYEREEMLGQHYSVIMPPDQAALANAHYARLLTGDVGIPVERKRQRKDGSIVYIEAANALVESVEGQKMVITTVRDITERKKSENITQARLRVIEFAREHSLGELLQNALDELCALTDSPIGFFHFVESNQRALLLQAWSTRTIEEMCTAEGEKQHYDIDQAGVWVDCVRQGVPVIHNDYYSLPHRKGLPEGHAPIIREMVFPITRNQKIVAVIGVGNKAHDYTEGDLAYASRLADILWDIAERKRVEQREGEQRALTEALSDSASALNSTLDFDDVLDRIMDNVGRVVRHDSVDVILLDESRRTARIVGHRDNRDQPVDLNDFQLPVSQTRNLRELQATGAPVIIADTHTYDGWVATPASAWICSNLGVPIKIKAEVIGFLILNSAMPNAFTQLDAERLKAFVNHAAIAIENARLYEEVQKLALTDALTGIYNRTFFEAELARMEVGRDFPVSIIVADLDNLKTTNDKLGHMAGDELVKNVAHILQEVFRAADVMARIGGDEFAVLLPNTDSTTAEKMLLRVRAKLAEHNAKHPHLPVLLSLGASTVEHGKLMEAFTTADQRMYVDKATRKSYD